MRLWRRWFSNRRRADETSTGQRTEENAAPPARTKTNAGQDCSPESVSAEARTLIDKALGVVETQVSVGSSGGLECTIVKGAGGQGRTMEVARYIEAAFRLHPDKPLVHYAWACALHLAAQYKSAKAEMSKCADAHPRFPLAQLALAGWDTRWQSMFTYPAWGAHAQTISSGLSSFVKTSCIMPIRDWIRPRGAIFLRDTANDFDRDALSSARIELASVLSPISELQMFAVYARIHDNPTSPFEMEIVDMPFDLRGLPRRAAWECLCLQDDVDFVIIGSRDEVLLNKRLTIPARMHQTNDQLLGMLERSDGVRISDLQILRLVLKHQQCFDHSDVEY